VLARKTVAPGNASFVLASITFPEIEDRFCAKVFPRKAIEVIKEKKIFILELL
jgi:hypothetical protein